MSLIFNETSIVHSDAIYSYLYTPILCMDANFRLKNQLVSNYSVDPGLGRGWSYTVPREPFEAYVQSRVGDIDIAVSASISFCMAN